MQIQILANPNRPEIKDLKLTRLDIACEVVALLLLAMTWAVSFHYGGRLSEKAPMDFSRAGVFVFPAISTMIYFLLLATNFVSPRLFNYPVQITPANARVQYTLARQMLSVMKVCLVIVFVGVTWSGLAAEGVAQGVLGAGLLPASLLLIGGNIAIYLYRARRAQ